MKRIKLIFVLAVTLLAAVSCLKSTNKQNFTWDVSFEEEGLKFHADDSTCFNSFVSFGNLIGFSAVVSGEENENLLGGFGICRGVDPTLTGTAAKTPYHCFAHPYLENEKTFAVFRQSGNMPEEQIIFNIPSAQSTISPRGVMLCNTHNFIQIAKLGNGFGEGKFTSGDWAEVKFTGSLNGAETGSVSFRMADFSGGKEEIVEEWTLVDLSPLGSVDKIDISLSSSRENVFQVVCLDHVNLSCSLVF
jgi:hypothetical protein